MRGIKRNGWFVLAMGLGVSVGWGGEAFAVPIGELGILDDSVNAGINPATGAAWAEGDVYRLAFVTSTTRDATSPDIADYHAHVQAAAVGAGRGLEGTTWYAILQTWNDQDRAANAYNYGSTNVPIILVDGTSLLANDINDLNNGPQVFFNMTEDGVTTYTGAVATGSSRKPGDPTQTGTPKIEHGASDRLTGQWWQVYNGAQESQWHFYAISADLTVGASGPDLPGDTDGDGDIDDADLGASFANYTGPGGTGKTAAEGDTDGDGDVDDGDLGTSFAGYTGPLGPAVPEPASLALIAIGGLALVRRRRRA